MAGSAAAATGVAVAVLLVLGACGGSASANTVVATITNVSAVTLATPPPTAHDYARFKHWSHAGISCESLEAGLRCQNGAGHGFMLTRGASASF